MGDKAINPYTYVQEATKNGERLLSLCCGIGYELYSLNTTDITAVDLMPQYLEQAKLRCPDAKTVCSDALSFLETQLDQSYDVISIIDGIEHMDKETGHKVIEEMQRVGKSILLFTPQGHNEDGFLKNEPHNAWGIEGADHAQLHKSGWTQEELEKLGFKVLNRQTDTSQHGEPYTALMMKWTK